MMFQIRLYAAYDSDLISIAFGGVFDATKVFRSAIDAFVRKEPPTFTTIPAHAKLCGLPADAGSKRILLDFNDKDEEDVINYITIIPDGSRNEVLKHIIRRMIRNDYYYSLFNFDDYFSPDVSPECSTKIRDSLDELERSVKQQIDEMRGMLTHEQANEKHIEFFDDDDEFVL